MTVSIPTIQQVRDDPSILGRVDYGEMSKEELAQFLATFGALLNYSNGALNEDNFHYFGVDMYAMMDWLMGDNQNDDNFDFIAGLERLAGLRPDSPEWHQHGRHRRAQFDEGGWVPNEGWRAMGIEIAKAILKIRELATKNPPDPECAALWSMLQSATSGPNNTGRSRWSAVFAVFSRFQQITSNAGALTKYFTVGSDKGPDKGRVFLTASAQAGVDDYFSSLVGRGKGFQSYSEALIFSSSVSRKIVQRQLEFFRNLAMFAGDMEKKITNAKNAIDERSTDGKAIHSPADVLSCLDLAEVLMADVEIPGLLGPDGQPLKPSDIFDADKLAEVKSAYDAALFQKVREGKELSIEERGKLKTFLEKLGAALKLLGGEMAELVGSSRKSIDPQVLGEYIKQLEEQLAKKQEEVNTSVTRIAWTRN